MLRRRVAVSVGLEQVTQVLWNKDPKHSVCWRDKKARENVKTKSYDCYVEDQ